MAESVTVSVDLSTDAFMPIIDALKAALIKFPVPESKMPAWPANAYLMKSRNRGGSVSVVVLPSPEFLTWVAAVYAAMDFTGLA